MKNVDKVGVVILCIAFGYILFQIVRFNIMGM